VARNHEAVVANAAAIERNSLVLQKILNIVSSDRVLIKDAMGNSRSRVVID